MKALKAGTIVLDEDLENESIVNDMVEDIKQLCREHHRLTGKMPTKLRFWTKDYVRHDLELKKLLNY